MPDEGNIRMLPVVFASDSSESSAIVVEMGAMGEAVSLVAVHYSLTNLSAVQSQSLEVGLSSNPENELFPFTGSLLPALDKSVYAYWPYDLKHGSEVAWVKAGAHAEIPLYGLIRPRRQVLVWIWAAAVAMTARAEIYYRPITMGKTDLDTLNLKYGKYRRRA